MPHLEGILSKRILNYSSEDKQQILHKEFFESPDEYDRRFIAEISTKDLSALKGIVSRAEGSSVVTNIEQKYKGNEKMNLDRVS